MSTSNMLTNQPIHNITILERNKLGMYSFFYFIEVIDVY